MSSAVRISGLVLVAVILSLSLAAQQAPEESPPVINETIDVRVVNVETVVTDAQGRRVRGLGREDFRLLVDGREVPVEYFSEMEEGRAAAGREAAVPPGGPGRSYLVFLDDSFSIAAHRNSVLAGIAADLDRLGPEDRMAVLAFDGRKLDLLCPWTADHSALATALAAARQRSTGGGQLIAQADDMDLDVELAKAVGASKMTLEMLAARRNEEASSQAGYTTGALAAALEGFAAPPGRKVLFLITAGWQIVRAPGSYGPIIRTANRLGYTMYPVDTVNLDRMPADALEWLAGTTGGKVVKTRLDHSAFAEALADSGSYYGLGFTPAWKGNDRGHQIRVEVRRSGVAVRSRQSFTDLSRQGQTAMRAESLLYFNGQEKDRRLRVELGKARPAGRSEVEVPVVLGVPVVSLQVMPEGKSYAAEVPLAIALVDERGRHASLPGARLRVTFKELPKAGGYARFKTVIKLRKAQQHIVFAVDDPVAGAVLWGEARVSL